MEHSSGRQLGLIGVNCLITVTAIHMPTQVIQAAGPDLWVSFLLAGALLLLLIWCLTRAVARFPNQDLFGALATRFPVAGRLLIFGYMLFFAQVFLRDTRMLIDVIKVILLQQTPLIIIGALVTATTILIARGGAVILGRITELFTTPLIAVTMLIPLMVVRNMDLRHIQPVLSEGLLPPLGGLWYLIGYVGETVLLAVIGTGSALRFRQQAFWVLGGTALIMSSTLSTLLVLGPHVGSRMMFPVYELIRAIFITDFLDRFDLFIVAMWMPAMLIRISYSLYAVCHGAKQILPSLDAKLLTAPVGALGLSGTFWLFGNALQTLHFGQYWPFFALWFELAIPAVLLLVLKPRDKGAAKGHTSST